VDREKKEKTETEKEKDNEKEKAPSTWLLWRTVNLSIHSVIKSTIGWTWFIENQC
jgi:hypothetical protein